MTAKKAQQLIINGLTDTGLVRTHNEDYISWDAATGLVILADGMGGHNAGEVASKLAVLHITDALAEVLSAEVTDNDNVDLEDAVHQAVVFANTEVHQYAQTHVECAGMGTTVVAGIFQTDSVVLASVGDSRVYRLRKDKLNQLTTDHSVVQEMIDNGYMTKKEALESNNRNLITRAIGTDEEIQVDVSKYKTDVNDIYLFCSDGLSDMLSDNEIISILVKASPDLERTSSALIALAKEKGGDDNVSVILVNCK